MVYDKPEVVMSSATIRAVQGFGCKLCDIYFDKNQQSPYYHTFTSTVNAYEADE